MKASVVTEPGGPEVLQIQDLPDPVPDPGEAVVRLAAANVNPTDLGARRGRFPPGFDIPGPPFVLGWDLAGEVAAVGDDVANRAVGDQVVGMIPWYMALGRYGAYAELVLLRAEWLVDLPPGMDPVQAATVPLNALTAQQAIALLKAPPGAQILITGASGAVGSFAVQLAVGAGLRVTAVAGSGDEEWVRSLGAEEVVPRETELSMMGAFPHVLDAVPVGAQAFSAVADGGTIVSTRPVEDNPGRGITQRSMLIEQDTEVLRELVQRAAAGALLTRVSQTVPLAEAARAHRLTEQRGRHGKVVLVP
jgi:NADPH:quinone reductase